ncbi:hypothetical protein HMPREF9120_01545 [Neisseria sp. oral taxon 020 str. F0370]|nr:hypothetical protein HMPREF9120_01545 [Neisseria sp. oral taxon 020 str. F0370]
MRLSERQTAGMRIPKGRLKAVAPWRKSAFRLGLDGRRQYHCACCL